MWILKGGHIKAIGMGMALSFEDFLLYADDGIRVQRRGKGNHTNSENTISVMAIAIQSVHQPRELQNR